ncbi:hypothetical protein CEXT_65461 [Caerostris extrusa]|uniref:Uncharacterized protein n=1 Tax=Caerostris extrusa TaxID=172846 RepID=A0AAV4V2Z5_CAEEX|nr:hypothetical protein CEXT_65461 [Caerostris extrusa]
MIDYSSACKTLPNGSAALDDFRIVTTKSARRQHLEYPSSGPNIRTPYSRPVFCVSSVRTKAKEGEGEVFSRIIYQNISGFHRDAPMNILNALSFDEGTRVNKLRRRSFHRSIPSPFRKKGKKVIAVVRDIEKYWKQKNLTFFGENANESGYLKQIVPLHKTPDFHF